MKPEDYHFETHQLCAEWDSKDTIEEIIKSIEILGYNVVPIQFNDYFVETLKDIRPDLVFNIVEGMVGEDREAQAPAIYEMLGIPYTGSGPLAQAIALNKAVTKMILEFAGIKTAPFQIFENYIQDSSEVKITYPAIVKPIHEGSSIGIDNNSVVENFDELVIRVASVINTFHQAALVEKYIEGREFNEAIIGNDDPILFPIVEIDYSYLPNNIRKFSSFEVKTILDDPNSTLCPADLTPEQERKIKNAVLGACRAVGIKDFARIDLRMDADDNVYILEINSIPGIAPGKEENNSMTKAIRTYGWEYHDMINAIITAALKRYNIFLEPEIEELEEVGEIIQENNKILKKQYVTMAEIQQNETDSR